MQSRNVPSSIGISPKPGNGGMKAAKIGAHYHDVRNGLRDAPSPAVQAAPASVGESPPDMRFAVIGVGSKSIKAGFINATKVDSVSIAKIAVELVWDLLSSHPGVAGIGLFTQMNGFLLTD